MSFQEKIAQYTKKEPHGTILGYTLLSRPKHAKLPDYPYGYTARAFKADKTTLAYAQIMWDFLPVENNLVGLKENDFPWDNDELAWVQGSEVLEIGNPADQQRMTNLLVGKGHLCH